MKKRAMCLLIALSLIFSTSIAFAGDDHGVKSTQIFKPLEVISIIIK